MKKNVIQRNIRYKNANMCNGISEEKEREKGAEKAKRNND